MSESDWQTGLVSVIRPGDGERIGFLRQLDDAHWEALNLLGIRLGKPGSRDDAERRVTSEAMASLAQPWWCRVPRPLSEPLVDARTVDEAESWDRVVVAEVLPGHALLRPMYAWPEESGHYLRIDLPAADILHDREPRPGDGT